MMISDSGLLVRPCMNGPILNLYNRNCHYGCECEVAWYKFTATIRNGFK